MALRPPRQATKNRSRILVINLQSAKTKLVDCFDVYDPHKHPYHVNWTKTGSSVDQWSVFAEAYYKVSVHYSLQLEIVLERLSRHASRQTVLSIWSNEGMPFGRRQSELWLDLIENLGNKPESVLARPALSGVLKWNSYFDYIVAHGKIVEVLAALYVCETFMPQLPNHILFDVNHDEILEYAHQIILVKNNTFHSNSLLHHLDREARMSRSSEAAALNTLQESASWTWNLLDDLEKIRKENYYSCNGAD
jgi:hypothetical protein